MPRPEGVDERIKRAQMERLLKAGCSKREAMKSWKSFKNQYLCSWRAYIDEGLIKAPVGYEARKK